MNLFKEETKRFAEIKSAVCDAVNMPLSAPPGAGK